MKIAALETKRGRVYLLLVLGFLTAIGPMSTDIYLTAFPMIANSFGTTTSAIQITFAASLLGLGLGQLLYGPIADRFGRTLPLRIGLTVFVLASIGCALAPGLPALVGLRFVQALGGSAGIVLSRAIVRDVFSGRDIARALSAIALVFAFGPVLAPAIGAAVLAVAAWPWIFGALAIFGAICLIGAVTLPETLPADRRSDSGIAGAFTSYGHIARTPAFLGPALIASLVSMGLFTYISSAPAIYLEDFHLSARSFSIIFGVGALFLAIGARVNMVLLRGHRVHQLLRAYLLLQLLATFVLVVNVYFRGPIWIFVCGIIAFQSCIGAVMGNAIAEVLRPFPRNAASAAALMGMMQMVLSALLASLLSRMDFFPPAEMSQVMFLVAALAFGISMLVRPGHQV